MRSDEELWEWYAANIPAHRLEAERARFDRALAGEDMDDPEMYSLARLLEAGRIMGELRDD